MSDDSLDITTNADASEAIDALNVSQAIGSAGAFAQSELQN